MTLFGSFKNLGLAATVALLLFGPTAAVPAAVCILTETGFYILLSALAGRRKGREASKDGARTRRSRLCT